MGNQLGAFFKKATKTSLQSLCHHLVIEGYNAMIKEETDIKRQVDNTKNNQNFTRQFSVSCPLVISSLLIIPDYAQWEEEDISEKLLGKMKEHTFAQLHKISVQCEYYLNQKETSQTRTSAKKARRIDFRFSNWTEENERNYFGEAKNLSCKDWQKKKGTNVQASKSIARYIETGIEALADGKYEKIPAFMIGYVVNGTSTEVVEKLNNKLIKENLPPKYGLIENQHTIHNHLDCYDSENPNAMTNKVIKHLFLTF